MKSIEKTGKTETPVNKEHRIGVYVCHCGTNIAGSVDVKRVAKCASTFPNVVVARDYTYVCSDAGQALIKQDIKKFKLDKVVVAACSPTLHESTFRKCIEDAGLNGYLITIANIREQCSWVHTREPKEATKKAIDLIRMAVARVSLLKPLEAIKVPVRKSCLVIGGGISGIQAALDLADEGFDVYLVEKGPSLGGHMAQLDKTFPTMDCSLCILSPKMASIVHHPKIHVLTNSEIKQVSGYVGNFKVGITVKPRYIIDSLCNGCGECAEACPIEVPNEFDENLGPRKSIYIPFPQAVPLIYTIDIDHCIKCYKCVEVCGLEAIDFAQEPKEVEIEVGTIVVATGFNPFDPSVIEEYGYGIYENVVTGIEFERIISPSGPSGGKIIRPSDSKTPKHVAFIQCVGSRDEKTNPYCSRVCCMYATKQALLVKEKIPDANILIFYIDLRAFGKGYEEFYKRAQMEGIHYIRGKVAEIVEDSKSNNLILRAEETLLGALVEAEVDLVVLSIGLIPSIGTNLLCRTLNISTSPDGFLREAHPKLRPMDTLVDGIFIAGVAQGPKDIPDCVAQASGAAQRASILMTAGEAKIEAITAEIEEDFCSKCLICLDACPFKALIVEEKAVKVLETLCKGCGSCSAACPSGAIQMRHFSDEQILAESKEALTSGASH
ncbi:MAG: CoB--CoM heterodisulfide reductase iron-sulfur subunit A family protein [Candidatus Bathyarchaeia archaeon]